jgi:hypothetical protein
VGDMGIIGTVGGEFEGMARNTDRRPSVLVESRRKDIAAIRRLVGVPDDLGPVRAGQPLPGTQCGGEAEPTPTSMIIDDSY